MKHLSWIGYCSLAVCSLALAGNATPDPSFADHEVKMMDADTDGKVSASEHAAGAKKMFDKMDANHDSKVTAAEMDGARKAIKGEHASKHSMSSAEKIRVIDTDQDGILSADEHAAGSELMFKKMDADKDGALTAQELQTGHKAMMGAKAH